MTYIKSGNIRVLEEKELKIKINYDSTIRKIDEELSNSYIYAQAEDSSNPNTNFYYFKQKGITKNDYNESLISIKKLIDEIFTDIPSINIFDFVTITKKGKFSKNRIVHLATPIVGLICKNSYYTCIKYFALEVNTINEDLAEMSWNFVECDPKKFETLFFKDYTKPVINEKPKAIKIGDIKRGTIYSDEFKKYYYLYLGNAKYMHLSMYKASPTLLSPSDFSDIEIENEVNHEIEEDIAYYKGSGERYTPNRHLYIKFTKEELKQHKTLLLAIISILLILKNILEFMNLFLLLDFFMKNLNI